MLKLNSRRLGVALALGRPVTAPGCAHESRGNEVLRVCRQQRGNDVAPHREPDDVCARDLEMLQQSHNVLTELLPIRFAVVRVATLTVAAYVKRYEMVVLCERGQKTQLNPRLLDVARIAVNQDNRSTSPLLDIVDASA